MRWFLIFAIFTSGLLAQDAGTPMPKPPQLPASSEKRWVVNRFVLHETVTLYDTWKAGGKPIAKLPPETVVRGLGKLSVVHQPDVIRMTKAMPEVGLKVGDTLLRYTYIGEGFADVWFNGRWYPEFDASFIKELDGSGCGNDHCHAVTEKEGRKEWWAHVRLMDGRDGWIRVPY